MSLDEYRRKRDFGSTPEPSGDAVATGAESEWDRLPHGHRFCVQEHRATRLHFDFRLEHNGVLLSWPIPRGPTLDPTVKRLAVQTEDHPVDYGDFEGVIPSGYGEGTVLLWDIGAFEWVKESAEDPDRQLKKGDVKFRLQGHKICGEFALVKLKPRGTGRYAGQNEDNNWLMIKKRDECVVDGYDAAAHEVSVKTGRNLAEIARDAGGDPRELRRAAGRTPRVRGSGRSSRGPDASTDREATDREREGSSPPAAPPEPPQPMLATSIDKPFSRDGWLFELKYDGVRALASFAGSTLKLVGRKGRDETARYPELATLPALFRAKDAIIDGEIVAFDDQGRPSFERLQSRINLSRRQDVLHGVSQTPVRFMVFDILRLDGRDLMQTALRIRKKTLRDVLSEAGAATVQFADHVDNNGLAFYEAVKAQGLEGVVGKRGDSVYQPGRRSRDWLKVKAWKTQTCVIIGYTSGQGRRVEHLGALILAVMRDGRLSHCGQVGTGFDEKTLQTLRKELDARRTGASPVQPPPQTAEPATWVRPELVCEVRFNEWTSAGILRHPAYLGLRGDLTPADATVAAALPTDEAFQAQAGDGDGVTGTFSEPRRTSSERGARREQGAAPSGGRRRGPKTPLPSSAQTTEASSDADVDEALRVLKSLRSDDFWEVGGRRLRLTNLDKVLWPDDGFTKRDMIAYYVRMGPYLLPYLRERPLSMQVFPDGINGKSFWRKDKPAYAPAWMDSWEYHGEKTKTYIVVNELATLAWVANAGVVDLHPWHSRIDAPNQPDWAVFDLDPFEPATFKDVIDIAKLVRAALDHYRMQGLVKTSGQTGLQIYVPVRRGPTYDAVRGWVEEVGRAIGQVARDRITWDWAVAQRTGKIRIDYTQNIINKTLAAPYSLRPAPRAPVSTPITWEELDDPKLRPDRWTIHTIGRRVAEVGDLFRPLLEIEQDLPATG
ncbi:MAG: DNA ligase D [Candidatus Dormibacteraeota bacterium]|nr:DNA ligase D [Candidatus Dormibacteraeota bacterium]